MNRETMLQIAKECGERFAFDTVSDYPEELERFANRMMAEGADRIRELEAENETLSNQYDICAQEARCMVDELAALRQQQGEPVACEKMRFALENCRLLAARHRKEDWALLILGFCAEGGVVGSVTRDYSDHHGEDWTERDSEYLK